MKRMVCGACLLAFALAACKDDGTIAYNTVPEAYRVITVPMIREADLNGTYPDAEGENLAFTVPVAGKEDFQ